MLDNLNIVKKNNTLRGIIERLVATAPSFSTTYILVLL